MLISFMTIIPPHVIYEKKDIILGRLLRMCDNISESLKDLKRLAKKLHHPLQKLFCSWAWHLYWIYANSSKKAKSLHLLSHDYDFGEYSFIFRNDIDNALIDGKVDCLFRQKYKHMRVKAIFDLEIK